MKGRGRMGGLAVAALWLIAGMTLAQDRVPLGGGLGPLLLGGLAEEPDPGDPLDTAPVGGLRLTLKAERSEAKAGEAVKLTLVFENVGKDSLRVFWPPTMVYDEYFTLRVRGPKVMRQSIQVRNMMAMIFGPANFPEIRPGEKKDYEFTLSGNPPEIQPGNLYLCAEGEYRIQVVYAYQGGAGEDWELIEGRMEGRAQQAAFTPWRGTVASNEVVIKLSGEFAEPRPNPAGRRQRPRLPRIGTPMPVPEVVPDEGGTPVEVLPNALPRLPAPETRNLPAPEDGR